MGARSEYQCWARVFEDEEQHDLKPRPLIKNHFLGLKRYRLVHSSLAHVGLFVMGLIVVRSVGWCREFNVLGTLAFKSMIPAMETVELALKTVKDTVRYPVHHLEAVLNFMLFFKRRTAGFQFRRCLADRHHHLRQLTCLRVSLAKSRLHFTFYRINCTVTNLLFYFRRPRYPYSQHVRQVRGICRI